MLQLYNHFGTVGRVEMYWLYFQEDLVELIPRYSHYGKHTTLVEPTYVFLNAKVPGKL